MLSMSVVHYTDYSSLCAFLFRVLQCNNVLIKNSIFTNENSVGYLDIVEHIFAW